MTPVLFAFDFWHFLIGFLLFSSSLFLIMLVLVQRGRGGGLAGAFGGAGGNSAFGSKAGDVFTKITIGTAFVWILLCIFAIRFLGGSPSKFKGSSQKSTIGGMSNGDSKSDDDASGLGTLGTDDGSTKEETTNDDSANEESANEESANEDSTDAKSDASKATDSESESESEKSSSGDKEETTSPAPEKSDSEKPAPEKTSPEKSGPEKSDSDTP